jgi:hypothetical protein
MTACIGYPSFFYCANPACSNVNGYDEDMNVIVRIYTEDIGVVITPPKEVTDEIHIQEGKE